MKKIFILALLFSIAACGNKVNIFNNDEASSRINKSENNSREIFDQIDE